MEASQGVRTPVQSYSSRKRYTKQIDTLDHTKHPRYIYRYVGKHEIRFVILLQGQEHEAINIEIIHETVDAEEGYAALSYVWGEHKKNEQPVIVGGRRVHWVTYNLWTALKQIRQKDMDLVLWIDALCINQKDKKEKSRQLPYMRWIYPRAEKVLCWLGEDDGTVSEAFEALRDWAKAYSDPVFCAELVTNTENYVASRRPGASNGLSVLFNRPYWRRAWCLQEICVDGIKPPLLLCGEHQLSWTTLYTGFLCMGWSLDNCASLIGDNVGYVLPMIKTCWKEPGELQMSDLIPDAAIREASDAHDMIFSLLGLAERRGVEYPAPEYTRTVEETCLLYTRAIITTDQRLCVLTTVDSFREEDSVPSWCIKPGRWAKGEMSDIRRLDRREAGTFRYSATKNMKPCIRAPQGPADPVLRLAGFALDKVADILDIGSVLVKSMEKAASWSVILDLCKAFCSEHLSSDRYAALDEPIIEAFLRTITCDDFWIRSCRETHVQFQDRFYAAYDAHMRSLGMEEGVTWMEKDQFITYLEEHFCFRAKVATDESQVAEGQSDNRIPHKFLDRRACLELLRVIDNKVSERKMLVTEKGYIGLGPTTCAVGDTVCLLPGSTVPFILRQASTEHESRYLLVGDAYVHGAMYGEALEGKPDIEKAAESEDADTWKVFALI